MQGEDERLRDFQRSSQLLGGRSYIPHIRIASGTGARNSAACFLRAAAHRPASQGTSP